MASNVLLRLYILVFMMIATCSFEDPGLCLFQPPTQWYRAALIAP